MSLEQGSESIGLLRRDFHAEHQRLGCSEFRVRHVAAPRESPPVGGSTIPRLSVFDDTHPQMRILVAEDETIIRLDLKQLLEDAGFEICAEAKDGA